MMTCRVLLAVAVYSSCHFKVIFHTTASYQQSVEMEKALHTLFSASISTQSPAANAPAEGRENDTELKKVQSKAEKEADAKMKAEAEMEKNDKFRRHCALMAMSNNVTVCTVSLPCRHLSHHSILVNVCEV